MNAFAARQELLQQALPLQTIARGGQRYSYRALGEGVTSMIMLHGIGSASASWMDLLLALDRFSKAYRWIAWDAPGYGLSTPLLQQTPRASDYADALDTFLATQNIKQYIIVGHSLGALMAAAYCARYSHRRLLGALFISPAQGYGGPGMRALGKQVRAERIKALADLGVSEMARLRSERLLSRHASQDAREWVQWNMATLHADGYRQAVELLCADDISAYAPLTIPVQVYCGEVDWVTPPLACAEIAAQFSAGFIPIPDAGHAVQIEAAPALAQILLSNIKTLSEQYHEAQ